MIDYSKRPIIISGCARSGTSLVAGVIHLCGAWKGITAGPNASNEKGMFENIDLRQNVIKGLLRDHRVDPLGQFPLPKTADIKIPMDFYSRVSAIVKAQGLDMATAWMWKGAKICLLWPIFNFHFPDSKWIIVRRKTPDIINSCMATGFMTAFKNTNTLKRVGAKTPEDGWLWWVREHEKKWIEMIEEGINLKQVWPERMINSDYGQMKETIEWLGLEWNEKEVVDFIEPRLWRARRELK